MRNISILITFLFSLGLYCCESIVQLNLKDIHQNTDYIIQKCELVAQTYADGKVKKRTLEQKSFDYLYQKIDDIFFMASKDLGKECKTTLTLTQSFPREREIMFCQNSDSYLYEEFLNLFFQLRGE